MDPVEDLLVRQDGVIARWQVLACGHPPAYGARKLRRREWVAVHPGGYVNHTGPLTWQQRAWAAVLACAPAALCGESARRAHEGPGRRDHDDSVIHLAVDRDRHLGAPAGTRLHRVAGFADRVAWNLGPPRDPLRGHDPRPGRRRPRPARHGGRARRRLRDAPDHGRPAAGPARRTLVDPAAGPPPHGPGRRGGGDLLGARARLPDRGRAAHGLPTGERQAARISGGSTAYLDVRYAALGLVVELDGRLVHGTAAARDRDLQRDLTTSVEEAGTTVRLGYGQVFDRPCATAAAVAAVMRRLGWAGSLTPCEKCGGSDEPG